MRQTRISQIVENQAPSDGRMDVGRCQLPLPRFLTCRPVKKRFRETYISLANKCIPLKNQYRSACSTLVCFNICLKQSFNTLLPLSMSVNDWNFPHLLFFRYFILLNTKRRLKNYPSYIIIEIKKELIGYKTSDCLSR